MTNSQYNWQEIWDILKAHAKAHAKDMEKLRVSQMKTDEHILELRESQKKTDKQLRETDKQLQRTDKQLQETDKQLTKTIKKLDDIGCQMAEMGHIHGDMAEDGFARNIKRMFRPRNKHFDKVRKNVKKKGVAEYDIVAVNGEEVLVVEVKSRLSEMMVDFFVEKRLPQFKEVFPAYAKYKVLGGVGGLVVRDEVEKYAERKGLYVLTQSSDGNAEIANKPDFEGKVFA